MTCRDCDALAATGFLCSYHDLITGGNSSPMRQAMAVTINPAVFEKIAASFVYFSLHHPTRPRKFGPWEERDVQEAFAAADRVRTLVGWSW